MTTLAELPQQVASLRRRRVATALVRSFAWYRALDGEQRYTVEERIGICCGAEPCSREAWLLAQMDLQTFPAMTPGETQGKIE